MTFRILKHSLLALILSFAASYAHAAITVDIAGVENEAAIKNIRARLSLLKLDDVESTPRRHIMSIYIDGREEIKEALQPFGYYQAEVTSSFEKVDGTWVATYTVTLGEPVRIIRVNNSINGPGANFKLFRTIFEDFQLKPGDTFNQVDYDNYKRRLLNAADQNGYFDAAFTTQQIIIDPDNNTAVIDLIFQTGEPYYFGSIRFDSEGFAESFLRRFLIIETGEQYSEEKLNELQSNLLNSGFFSYSAVESDREDIQDDDVPVTVHLRPRKHFTYTAGVGYGTDTGARASLGFQWRNITDTGHSLRFSIDPAQYIQTYSAAYRIPAKQPAFDYYEILAAQINEEPQGRDLNSRTRQFGGLWSVGQPLNSMQRILSLTYQDDRYRDKNSITTSRLVLPRAIWEWIRAKDRYNTYRGYRIRFETWGTAEEIGSTTTFIQAETLGKGIYSFNDDYRVIGRTQLGVTADANLQDIPPSLRFYAGGDNSVRGFAYQSLGERQFTNSGKRQIIGGKYLIVGSIEFERVIWGDFSGAVFFDTGNAMNDLHDPLAQSVGWGLRYKTPIGPVRADLATPISKSTNAWRLHINLGPDL